MTADIDSEATDAPAGEPHEGSSEEGPRAGAEPRAESNESATEEPDTASEMEDRGARLRASVERLQERLQDVAEDLRARDAADSIRDGVRRYPVLSVLGAAAAGVVIARALGSSGRSVEAEDLRDALEAELEGPHPREHGRTEGERVRTEDVRGGEEVPAEDGSAAREDAGEHGDAASSRSWKQSLRGGGKRAGRELGDLVRESVQAAVLSILTRKLNDWLGPRTD